MACGIENAGAMEPAASAGHGITLLIVEDEILPAMALKDELEYAG